MKDSTRRTGQRARNAAVVVPDFFASGVRWPEAQPETQAKVPVPTKPALHLWLGMSRESVVGIVPPGPLREQVICVPQRLKHWFFVHGGKCYGLAHPLPVSYGDLNVAKAPKSSQTRAKMGVRSGRSTGEFVDSLHSMGSTVFSQFRDLAGAVVSQLDSHGLDTLVVTVDKELPSEALRGFIFGLEMACYRFKPAVNGQIFSFALSLHQQGALGERKGNKKRIVENSAIDRAWLSVVKQTLLQAKATQFARHWTNLPPNWLTPLNFAQSLKNLCARQKRVEIEIWDQARLKKERMNLLLAVGQSSVHPPCFLKITIAGTKKSLKKICLIGKGVTFDTGGLDLKPSNAMRLMKKDMGGAAAVAAVALWANKISLKRSLEVLIPLAENAVGSRAQRPSDIVCSRANLNVEIHNTDAEGRLILADALDVAVTSAPEPHLVIDVATLTGAIKVALGSAVAGAFSNSKDVEQSFTAAANQVADWAWGMPLFQPYRAQLVSPFAHLVNCVDGFGGAITAALFLERFVAGKQWLHLDIYGWKDGAEGCYLEAGGSGQGVMALTEFLLAEDAKSYLF